MSKYSFVGKGKGNVILLHAMEARGGERRYSSYSFLTLALDGGEWAASRPGQGSNWFVHIFHQWHVINSIYDTTDSQSRREYFTCLSWFLFIQCELADSSWASVMDAEN
jgi:hypothetical protein